MTDVNHRRKNRPAVDRRRDANHYRNGFARREDSERNQRTGRTGFLDKSMHGSCRKSLLADKSVAACIGNDFHHGHRGMAKAVKGAKKFVKSRIRFHEKAATQKMANVVND